MSENTENLFESASTEYLAETAQASAEFTDLIKKVRFGVTHPHLFTKEEIVDVFSGFLDIVELAMTAGSMAMEAELITRDPSSFPSEN